MESTGWQQLNLALCSLNLAEASTSIMSRDILAQIYATAAVTVMHTLVDNLHFIAVSYPADIEVSFLHHNGDHVLL